MKCDINWNYLDNDSAIINLPHLPLAGGTHPIIGQHNTSELGHLTLLTITNIFLNYNYLTAKAMILPPWYVLHLLNEDIITCLQYAVSLTIIGPLKCI